ncbi:MAG: hypothetical protein JW702_06295 [Clostridiales bacterium]|nr:hypothetical protein [Clostridiales bacterium]
MILKNVRELRAENEYLREKRRIERWGYLSFGFILGVFLAFFGIEMSKKDLPRKARDQYIVYRERAKNIGKRKVEEIKEELE